MLTREQAKTKDCPHFYNHEEKTYRKCQAEDCPKWKESFKVFRWCSQIKVRELDGYFDEIIVSGKLCPILKENPKLEDEFNFESGKYLRTAKECNNCTYRYGYCGG